MKWNMAMATSSAPTVFGPLLFAGNVSQCIKVAAELGYDGVEISLRAPEELNLAELKRMLKDHGLRMSALASGRSFLEDKLSFSDRDPEVRRRAVERIKADLDFSSELGAPVIIGLVRGAQWWSADGKAENGFIVECMQECADYAAARGTGLIVEPVNRYESRFQNTCEDTMRLLDNIGRPNVTILLDIFHMNIEEVSIGDAIRRAGPRLGYVHVVDSNRRAAGWGHVDYTDIVAALKEINFQRWVSAECLPVPDSRAAAEQARTFVSTRWV